jgi:hypothetical protein
MTADDKSHRLQEIAAELRGIERRRDDLLRERERLLTEQKRDEDAVAPLSPSEKISPSLFHCRGDVYPRLWENGKTGKKGYSPVCRNEWSKVVCKKPRVKCSECPNQSFPPLDEVAVRDHLTGKHTIGTYAIRQDNTCVFLAADFNGAGWREDVRAYREAEP